jgi:hypothetical protein
MTDTPYYEDVHAEIVGGSAGASLPRWADGVLADVAAGRRDVRAVRHPLGFLCLPLERIGDTGICLHLWSADYAALPTTSGVHCHSWDLLSFVLSGELGNIPARVAVGRTHRVFEIISVGDVDEVRATRRTVASRPGPVARYRAGEVYEMPAGAFHSTMVPDGHMALTVALGRGRSASPDLSLGPLSMPSHNVRRRRCGAGETIAAAIACARLLGRGDPDPPHGTRRDGVGGP